MQFDPLQTSNTPTITFLISTYNRRDVLLNTLAQLTKFRDDGAIDSEIILVDNASKDGTPDAVSALFPTIRVIRQTCNRGPCAKNAGLPFARGEFIVFLDDDSYPRDGTISRMIQHFRADPKLGAAVFDIVLPDGSHECSAYPTVFIGCGTGFRRAALEEVGGLPTDYFMAAEEYDLSLRLLNAGWRIQRLDDLVAVHLKTPGARQPTRITRFDVRNNLTLITRFFPPEHLLPFAIDWMRRYRWIAKSKGRDHEIAFWRGLAEGIMRSFRPGHRRPISSVAFETFAMIDAIESRMRAIAQQHRLQTILLIDVGKNIYPFSRAAIRAGLKIVAVADARLARQGRKYLGVPVVDDTTAQSMQFDAAIIANVSPVHAALRGSAWRQLTSSPVIDLLENPVAVSLAA
jgi:GT2 family glycosyltransferase